MHPELKHLITNLPKLIIADFNVRAVPVTTDVVFPLSVPAIFAIVREECMAQAGVDSDSVHCQSYAKDALNIRYKLYRTGANKNLSRLLLEAVQAVLARIDPQLQVALSALLLRTSSESDMIKLLGAHYANDMDRDLPLYIQYAINWHRNWCDSKLPKEMEGTDYPYTHTEVPVLTFMYLIVGRASGRDLETNKPWAKEISVVVYSKMEWLSPTETEMLRISTSRLEQRDIENDFLKYFL